MNTIIEIKNQRVKMNTLFLLLKKYFLKIKRFFVKMKMDVVELLINIIVLRNINCMNTMNNQLI